jgi:ZIP family zinc transporter
LPVWIEAFLWGLIVGSGLILGAVVSYFSTLSHRVIATIMGFGGGVLISILSFELMEEAYAHGGLISSALGFFAGAVLFSSANWFLARSGARHRKRCSQCIVQFPGHDAKGSELAIAVGSILDGVPEAIIVGISLVGGVSIGKVVLIGFFLSNIPEGLSSASGMKESGRSARYIFGVWGGITLLTGLAALVGYSVLGNLSDGSVAFITALAAGGILSMLAETMIPEAFEEVHSFIGLITAAGFFIFFLLMKLNL